MLRIKNLHVKELLKGSSIAMGFRLFGMLSGYLFAAFVTRQFGMEAMGIFALSLTILEILTVIGKMGLDTAILRFSAVHFANGHMRAFRDVYVKSIMLGFPLVIVLAIGLYLGAGWISDLLFDKDVTGMLRLISLVLLFSVLHFLNSELIRGTRNIFLYQVFQRNMIYFLGFLILAASVYSDVFTFSPTPTGAYLFSMVLLTLISGIFCIRLVRKQPVKTETEAPEGEVTFKSLLDVSIPMLMASSMYLMMHWTDTLMLGYFRTEAEVGQYFIAMKIAMIANMVLLTVNVSATPKFAQLYEKDFRNFRHIVTKSTKMIFWATLPIVLFILLFDTFVLGLFGEGLEPARYAMLILVMGQFFSAISGSVANIMKMTGAHRTMQKFLLFVFIVNIVLNLVLIPRYGIEGAAIATAGSTILLNLLCVIYIYRRDRLLTIYLPFVTGKLNRKLSR